ncbi:MAG: hypothetical protein HY537_01895, partial [Deltaproteobacteria bacterium]|nr:hypothetical protein [Deltaproteobacteria bacterium]
MSLPSFPYSEKICRIENPLNWTHERTAQMVDACREMAVFHYENCPEIRFIYDKVHFDPKSIAREQDLARIPSVGVTAMKYFALTSLPHSEAVLKLTSSGTRGQKTQIWFDRDSLDRVQMMLETLWKQLGKFSDIPTNYLMFVYDPEQAKDLGIAFSCKNDQRFAPPLETVFVIKKNSHGTWQFQNKLAYETLLS